MKPVFYKLVNKIIVITLLFLFPNLSFASGEIFPFGSRSAAMGRCSVALQGFWGIQNNQAAISSIDKYSIGINYENRFTLKQTSYKSVAFIAPLNIGVLGLSYNHYGYKAYNEQKIGLVYARNFGKIISIGIQLDYFSVKLGEDYGQKNNVSFELGLQSNIIDNLCIGIYVFNPIRVKLTDNYNEKLPAILRFGLAYRMHNNLIITTELEKSSYINPILFRFGLEYAIKSKFYIRGGIASRYEIFSFGFGINLKQLKIDMAACMHESLGFSPQMGLIFNF